MKFHSVTKGGHRLKKEGPETLIYKHEQLQKQLLACDLRELKELKR